MSWAPSGREAKHVPEIRDSLIRDLDGHVGESMRLLQLLMESEGKPAPTTVEVEKRGLAEAKLFWVPPEETAVLTEAAKDLPENLTLDPEMMPSASGFVVFGGDWFGTDAVTGTTTKFPVRAYRWGPVALPIDYDDRGFGVEGSEAVEGVAISAYSYTVDIDSIADPEIERVEQEKLEAKLTSIYGRHFKRSPETHAYWMPLGRTDWQFDQHWQEHPIFNTSSVPYSSLVEDRCIMTALWALMAACSPVDIQPDRAARRRAERKGRTAPSVRVVTWRGPRGQSVAVPGSLDSESHIHVRYHVRGHWRNARVGPGRTGRRWVYIPPHWRGPDDAPLSNPHETIHKVVKR